MAVLEAMAAGTPVVVSDADSMPELWSDAAIVLKRPIDLGEWYETVSEVLDNPVTWKKHSIRGRRLALKYDWPTVALRYLEAARGS
jgi:glycosyltransferase involved in cell wall biosynthesis